MKDSWIREQLLQDATLKEFDGLLKKAIALEASRFESSQLSKPVERVMDGISDTLKIIVPVLVKIIATVASNSVQIAIVARLVLFSVNDLSPMGAETG